MRAAEIAPPFCRQSTPIERAPRPRTQRLSFWVALFAAASASAVLQPTARAQEPSAAPPPSLPPAPTEPKFEAAPVVTGPVAPQPTVQAEAPQEEPALAQPDPVEEKPAPEPSILAPKLKIGIGVRTGLSMVVNNDGSGGDDDVKLELDDGLADQLLIRPYFSGELTKNIGVVANFEIGTNGKGLGFSVLDAIAQVKIADEFQIWVGQHIPANDRTNFSGPFFHNSWNFAIAVPSYPFDRGARDRGFTFWGLIAGGILKYHLSMVDLQKGNSIQNSRFAGRVTFNFLDPENYYYASGTYYGAQDVLAVGGVLSYQKGADGGTDANMDGDIDNEFFGGSVDLLFEKRLGTAGTFTLEGGYWNFEGVGADYAANQSNIDVGTGVTGPHPGQAVLASVSWLSPKKIGIAQIQPNFRLQYADYDATGETKVYDVGLAYVIDGFNHRWHFNYRHVDAEATGKEDILQLGAQFQL